MRMVGEEFKLGESIHIFKATVCSFVCVCVCVCVCIYIYIYFFFFFFFFFLEPLTVG